VREVSFQARRCHLTSPTSGAVSLGYPSSHPLPTTISTPLRIWLSSSTTCIRYTAPLAFPMTHLCLTRQACFVLLVISSNVLHVVLEGCCNTVMLVLSAGTEAAIRSAYDLPSEEVKMLTDTVCTNATRSYSHTPSNTLTHAKFEVLVT